MQLVGDSPEPFRGRERVFIRRQPYVIERSRVHQGALLLKLAGIDSPEAAEALRDAVVEVPESDMPSLPEDVYYHYQIVGLRVVTTAGEPVGDVVSILATGSNDVYVVRGTRGETLVPAIADVVKAIDLEHGTMTIEPIPGLLE